MHINVVLLTLYKTHKEVKVLNICVNDVLYNKY